jgi:putative tricarboxylic transport membrane protein
MQARLAGTGGGVVIWRNPMLNRRRFLMNTAAASAAGLAGLHLTPAFAEGAPQIQIFVPAAPGGGWDQTGRTMDQVLRSEKLISGSQITNVGGAGGTVGPPTRLPTI